MRFLPYRLPAAAFGGVCKSGPPRKGFLPPCGETGDAERRNEGRIIVFLSVRSLSPRCQRMSKLSSSRPSKIELYKKCAEYALRKGIIIADTKFEFGLDKDGNMVIGDEMLTPDSSRFWPAEGYEPGHGQPSFDKQFARDWLKANPDNDWTLPQDIVDKTIGKYLQGYEMLTGKKL